MLINEKIHQENDGSIGYYEIIFTSGNILKTTYFPKINRLYIAFKRGDMYSYENITNEMFEDFKNSESQGVYFHQNIFKNKNFPSRREFKLLPSEINEIEYIINDNDQV